MGLVTLRVGEKGAVGWFIVPKKGLAVLFIGIILWAPAASETPLKPFCCGMLPRLQPIWMELSLRELCILTESSSFL